MFNNSLSGKPFRRKRKAAFFEGYGFLPFMIILVIAVMFSGCKKKEAAAIIDEPDPDIIMERPELGIPKWLPGDYAHVAFVFGVGYETEELRAPVISYLSEEFGMAENGGLIEPLVFPPEYMNGKRINVSFLSEALKNKDICGLVLLGSPDRAYYALMDLVESSISYPVWSIFPVTYTTDEILGTECGSFFVMDYKDNGENTDSSSDSALIDVMDKGVKRYSGDISDVMTPIIRYIKKTSDGSNDPYSPADAVEYLKAEYENIFDDFSLTRFVEPESRLPSLNHYVLRLNK
ncbi:MAG: hypothetical protein K5930_06775 [Treponemataceae bacterium]|nr:hypothetical protein [Treponemataceae bacterium]